MVWFLGAGQERSRSILRKIYDAILKVADNKLGEVILLSNKVPDRKMEDSLKGNKFNFDKIDVTTRKQITDQLGDEKAARFLFSKLTVQHSDQNYLMLRNSVEAELLNFTDQAGVERLINRSHQWAMFRDTPSQNGWIHLHHLRELLSPQRPDPIPELFAVPEDYCVPDVSFHERLLGKIKDSTGEVITLTGSPGSGKSTYLSFLCEKLDELKIPLIRHHYFLSLGDSTTDRLSPRIVAESLLHQISSFHNKANADTSRPEGLSEALEQCASYYKSKGTPFVVLIDGLDHVWRDNGKNKKPLEEIFKQILPTTENLVVLIGTQPVDDELLPNRLLQYSPKVHWQWLPSMTGNSIYDYLKQQLRAGRLFTNFDESQSDSVVRASASALLGVTNGYPLHVIYSVEYLSQNGKALTDWEIEKLPPCIDGNISNYYSDLWRSLNYKQRDVLHLCSGFQFAWPRNGIGKVVSDEHSEAPSVDAVAHMFSEGFNGIRPFHESLVVFVKNQEEHERRVAELLPSVCDWLSNLAPLYLRDNWLWSSQAKAGDSNPLRQGVNRDWILDRVTHGMPVDAFLRLLSEAEYYAFEDNEYSEAYRHRELKMRLANGPKFQIWDSTNLEILSTNSADSFCMNEVLSRQNEYSPTRLSILAISLWAQNDIERAQQLSRKAISRYRTNSKLMNSSSLQDDENETVAVIKAGVLTDSLNFDSIFDKAFVNWSDKLIKSFRDASCMISDMDLLLRAWKILPNNHDQKRLIELDVIRLSILEKANIGLRQESKGFLNQGLLNFINLFSRAEFPEIFTDYLEGETDAVFKVEPKQDYSDWFFSSLNFRLVAEGDFCWLPINHRVDDIDTSRLYEALNHHADAAAITLFYDKQLSFEIACAFLDETLLINDLRSRVQESEVVEVLCIFYVAKIKGYQPPSGLGLNIKARSALSDLILEELDPKSITKGNYAGQYLPFFERHKNDHGFSYYQGTHVPRIYYHTLQDLEKLCGVPLTEVYVSEWNNTYEYQPVSDTSIDYFLEGARSRNTGHFYTQASHRGRSAYLRTIEISKRFFGMPDAYSETMAIKALPIEPAYIGLKFEKPSWLKNWSGKLGFSKEIIQDYVMGVIEAFQNARPVDELLAFSFPIMLNSNEWIDLTIQRAFRNSSLPDELLNNRYGFSTAEFLENSQAYEFEDSLNGSFLAQRTHPLGRYGHFYSDIESRGLYVPKFNLNGKRLSGKAIDGAFTFDIDGKKIGTAGFWFNDWQPSYPKGIKSLCGTYTSVNKSATSEWFNFTDSEKVHFYSCKVNVLSSQYDYSDLDTSQLIFEITDGGNS